MTRDDFEAIAADVLGVRLLSVWGDELRARVLDPFIEISYDRNPIVDAARPWVVKFQAPDGKVHLRYRGTPAEVAELVPKIRALGKPAEARKPKRARKRA